MAIEIIPLNGKSPYIDYKAFDLTILALMQKYISLIDSLFLYQI